MNAATSTLGKLFLLPVPLTENALNTIPEQVQQQSIAMKYFFVENVRTARRYLKLIDKNVDIDAIQFSEVNNQTKADLALLEQWLKAGYDIGIMSEAGCPAMADPGSDLVAHAQKLGATVVPLVGPSSVLLALMASGFNGQSFRFVGYLPVKEPMRGKAIKEMEAESAQRNETQIFIETPYRNNAMMQDLIRHCQKNTKICVAVDLTSEMESVRTQTASAWTKQLPELHKRPAIFLIHT
jgi:16S rRNA (cytidine1402-2'-O)-methyltransferase